MTYFFLLSFYAKLEVSNLVNNEPSYRGLKNAGLTVGAAKVTGTDFPKDLEYYLNGGASYGLTFAEFGYSSTHSLPHSELDTICK